MAVEGVDYSYSRPTPAQLKAAGKQFALRYVSSPGHAKNLTRVEAAGLKAAGIAIGIVFELTTARALSGRGTGRDDATSARSQVVDLGGPPDGGVIYFAVDFDAQPDQMPTILAYGEGWADVLGKDRCGPYGSYRVCKAFLDAGFDYAWNCASWSHGLWEPRAQLQQYRNGQPLGSGTVDLDRAMADDYGQWKETDVPLTEAEWDRLQGLIDARADTTEASLKAKVDQVAGLLFRGDPGTPDGGTHADNLKSIRAAVLDAGITLSPADLEQLAALVAAKLEIAGHPGYEGEAVISMRPRPAAP
jgi:hypothetical protein